MDHFARDVGGSHRRGRVNQAEQVDWSDSGHAFRLEQWIDLDAIDTSLGHTVRGRLSVSITFRNPWECHIASRRRTAGITVVPARGSVAAFGVPALDAAFTVRTSDARVLASVVTGEVAAWLAALPEVDLDIGARRGVFGQPSAGGRGQLVVGAEWTQGTGPEPRGWWGLARASLEALRRNGICEPAVTP